MNDKLKIAVCQLRTELDGAQTMDKAASFVRRAAEGGADFCRAAGNVLLPLFLPLLPRRPGGGA